MVQESLDPERTGGRRGGSDRRRLSVREALRPPSEGWARAAVFAIWCAFTVGLAEVAVVAIQQQVVGTIVYRSPHFVWMAPVGSLTVFLPLAAALWLLAWRWPAALSPPVVAAVMLFHASLTLLVLPGWLHLVAALLLAAGVTPHLSRFVVRHEAVAARIVRRTLPVYGVAIAVLATMAFAAPVVRERRALATLPPAPDGAPNILLIILDTVRGGSLSLLGYGRETTPQLEWLGARGVTFERAIAPAPWTLPSHASVFTGRQPNDLSASFANPLDDAHPTLAEVLARSGYATAGFVANYFNADYEHGVSRGFHHWEDHRVSFGQVVYNAVLTRRFFLDGPHGRQNSRLLQILDLDMRLGEKTASEVSASALQWLSERRTRPAFVFLNYFDAHYPYDPPAPYDRRFGSADTVTRPLLARARRAMSLTRWRGESRRAERERLNLYEEEISALDSDIGQLLRELDARGILDNTLVIITSDHGEEFGEHGRYEHGNDLYLTQLHVPLVMSWPKHIPSGRRVATPVGLRHLPETILDVAGLAGAESVGGRSLESTWIDQQPLPMPVLSVLEKPNVFQASLVTPRLHYVYADGQERLFDHVADPAELHDLTDEAWAEDTLEALRRHLAERLGEDAPSELVAAARP